MKLRNILPALLAGVLTVNAAQAADNVHFSGALVAEPCTIPDADTDIHIDFGSVIVKYLYQYQRTKTQPILIHLDECDPSIMKTVSITFKGTPDSELTDMLALDGASTAKGVAIGLELTDGTFLAVNEHSPYTQLTSGDNLLKFGAFVQAQPSVIANKTLTPGEFKAISTFELTYQ